MSTYSDSLIVPKELLDFFAEVSATNKSLIALLYHLLAWFRGEMRLGANTSLISGIVASAGGTAFIQPPDASEEWEVCYVMVQDTAKIDVADIVNIAYVDQITANVVELQQSTLQLGTGSLSTSNINVFPNRDTTSSKVSIVTNISDQGFVAKWSGGTPWQALRVQYTATATVGTRIVNIVFVYRRRKLS